MKGPTERSLRKLRADGYDIVEVVEKWIPQAKRRRDFAGILDIIAIGCGEILGVQTTSYSNVSARVKKIEGSENTPVLRDHGIRLVVHGWRRKGRHWVCREVDVS